MKPRLPASWRQLLASVLVSFSVTTYALPYITTEVLKCAAISGRAWHDNHAAAIGWKELVVPAFCIAPAKLKQVQYEFVDVLVLTEVHSGSSVAWLCAHDATEAQIRPDSQPK
jgi:hypothetical protein